MSIEKLQQEITELKEGLAKDRYELGQKAHNLRTQADRIDRHFEQSEELIKMKKDQLDREILQGQMHDKAIEE